MRLELTIAILLGLVGCGNGLVPGAVGENTPPPSVTTDASVSPMKASDIAGVYTIQSVWFDPDAAVDVMGDMELTRTLTTFKLTSNGVQLPDFQARLDEAYLIIHSSGVFSFYYSIVDQEGKPISVGPFKSGNMSGMLKLEVKSIGFVAGASNGLADEQEAMYDFKSEKNTITLTDTDKEILSPHFSIIHATKE